jgi:two-component system chemotaxis response regulator CheY
MGYGILIVDDSATTRAIIKRTIQMAQIPDVKLHEAPNGKAALELLATIHVDLVLADLHMPEMDGVEMAKRILTNPATGSIRVVVVSAEPNVARIEQLKSLGIVGYLRKPFTPEGIRNLVEQSLGVAHV